MAQPGAGGFVGRHSELAALREALDDGVAGRGRLVLLVGEPGIGKTRLAEEVAADARRRGADVLWGRAWEGEGAPALWPWVQVLRGWIESRDTDRLRAELGAAGGIVAHVVPELRERLPELVVPPVPEGEAGRFGLLDAVATVLRRAARTRPLVLVLDDLHWADEPSLELLLLLTREVAAAPILVVGTYRDTDVDRDDPKARVLGRVAREGASNVLHGFGADDVRALVLHTAGVTPSPSLVAAVLERTDGNPLFVGEIVRLLIADRAIDSPGTPASWIEQIPVGVQETIRRRIERLPPECAAVLAGAAVLGREFELRVLDRMQTSASAPTSLAVIDAAVDARLVVPIASAPGRYRFAHALVRDTLYADLLAAERVRLHRAAGRALEDVHRAELEPHLAALAHHFLAAGVDGDAERALGYAERAARRALELRAYEEAVRLYELALVALGLTAADGISDAAVRRTELLLALADARSMVSDDLRARESYVEVAEMAGRLGLVEPLARAALGAGGRGDMAGAPDPRLIALLERALVVLGPADSPLRSRVLSRLSGALTLIPETRERRIRLADEGITTAERTGDPDALAFGLVARHLALFGPGHLEDRLAVSERLVRLVDTAGSRESLAMGLQWRAMALLEAGDIQAVDQVMQRFAALADELRQPARQVHVAEWKAMRALLDGRFAEAESRIETMLEVGAHADAMNTHLRYVSQMSVLRREQGRLEEMIDALLGIVAAMPAMPAFRAGAAVFAAETGREAEARVHFEALAADDFASFPRDAAWAGGIAQLARACAALADGPRAAVLYDLLLPDAERNLVIGFASACEGAASHFLGLLAALQKRWDEGARHFEAALAMNARMGARPALAHTQREYATMLLRRDAADDGARAEVLLSEASRTYADLGMHTFLERTAALARPRRAAARAAVAANVLRREGDVWLVSYEGTSRRLNDAKGLRYIAQLVAHPGQEFHVVDLAGVADVRQADATPAPDDQARLAYRRRLAELREQLEEAESFNDIGRTAALREEMDAIAIELAGAYGLRGARVRTGAERIRKAVTKCIRDQIAKIGRVDDGLGRHLTNAIRTGTFCAYAPEKPVAWEL